MTDKHEIARWLMDQVQANGQKRSYQSVLVKKIRELFGEEWTYRNHNGNLAIDPTVLIQFRTLKDEFVFWDRSDQSWRVLTPEQLERMRARDEARAERRAAAAQRRAERDAASGETA